MPSDKWGQSSSWGSVCTAAILRSHVYITWMLALTTMGLVVVVQVLTSAVGEW
ncbi:hypothetical protein L208DRAFT_1416696 [Tricholoma matsutake]|nr:hypothetical protein L208DRAFT_1416696 [Tricholoma matsutake 945]